MKSTFKVLFSLKKGGMGEETGSAVSVGEGKNVLFYT